MRFARPAMKIAVLTAVGATALAACGSSGSSSSPKLGPAGAFGTVPAATGTPHAGTVTVAEQPNTAPTWIMPLVTAAANSVYNDYGFDYQMWRPLYWYVNGVHPTETPSLSLANEPKYSNGDKTVTVTLKSNYKWSNGKPITSQDVALWWYVMKAAVKESPANWAPYTPQLGIPDQVTSFSTPNSSTFVMNLNKAVNPSWFTEDMLGDIQPMPAQAWARTSASGPLVSFTNPANAKKIYNYLAAASKPSASWPTSPLWKVVDGPYNLSQFNVTTGAYTMTPNKSYGGPHSKIVPTYQGVPFTSDDAEVNAVKSGSVDVGYIPQTNFKQIPSIKKSGYNVYGYPDFGFNDITYNFKDKTGDFDHIIGQLYIRQAIAHVEDEAGYVKAFYFGAGATGYGPVPTAPSSPYTPANALTNPYPFSVTDAVNLLKSHGWTVKPGGTDVCAKAGTAANECGAGIPAGTKLTFPLVYGSSPAILGQEDTDLASEASKAGIKINLSSNNFDYMVSNFNNPSSPKTVNKWAMSDFGGWSISTYPTTLGLFNGTGSSDMGSYNDSKANSLIQASVTSPNPNAVKNEAAYLGTQQPVLFQPEPDWISAWKKTLSGPPADFESLTQYQVTPELWYLTKK